MKEDFNTTEEVKNSKCCKHCIHFEERTHFCRLNPPIPMIFPIENKGNNYNEIDELTYVSSKFPVISRCTTDYCSHFSPQLINKNDI